MTLYTQAQELIVLEPTQSHMGIDNALVPLEIVQPPEEILDQMDSHLENQMSPMEIAEPIDVEIVIEELPGAPEGTVDPEPAIEVQEEEPKTDENEAKKSKKPEKWDWASKGSHGFIAWIKERVDDIPKHSGYDSAGLERAVSYLDKLDNEISKAMRMDLDGELDANKIEQVRSQIDYGISRLHDRLDKIKKSKKSKRKKSGEFQSELVKEGQKITGVQGVYVTVPLLISRIARICINGMVSAGHDIEDIYAQQVKKYKLNEREQAEVRQLLEDMGYALRQDRGYFPDEDVDVASSNNFDWAANYKG